MSISYDMKVSGFYYSGSKSRYHADSFVTRLHITSKKQWNKWKTKKKERIRIV